MTPVDDDQMERYAVAFRAFSARAGEVITLDTARYVVRRALTEPRAPRIGGLHHEAAATV